MEIVDVFVEYPSGMSISDSATYARGFNQVCVSERLAAVLRKFSATEAPPEVKALIEGESVVLLQCTMGASRSNSQRMSSQNSVLAFC